MRVLIMSTAPDWIAVSRLPAALRMAGFEVAVLCPANGLLVHSAFVERRWTFSDPVFFLKQVPHIIQSIFESWSPEFVIPGDDFAAHLLQWMSPKMTGDAPPAAVLRRSVGDPDAFDIVQRKSRLPTAAAELGIAVVPHLAAPHPDQARAFADSHGFPVVVKPDFGVGGRGLHVCNTHDELAVAMQADPGRSVLGKTGTLSLQKYVDGEPAEVTLCALDGQMLAAFAVAKHQAARVNGPIAVARALDNPEMIEAAAKLVRRFGHSGFAGVGFIIDKATGKPLLFEFNPRLTTVTHLGALLGANLATALMAGLHGRPIEPPAAPRQHLVTMFPIEWMRDQRSPFLHSAYHDVPWEDPPLLRQMLNLVVQVTAPRNTFELTPENPTGAKIGVATRP